MNNLGVLSIRQPVLACVMSLLLLIVGGLAMLALPISEYPDVVPPTVVVTASYPGANAQTVADTVAAPIEQEVNGTEGMLYMSSQSTSDGRMVLTVTFRLGTDPDRAQVLVQGAVNGALPRLPEEVRRFGVTTRKLALDRLMIIFVYSPDDSYDQLYVSNYALRQVREELLRIDGIGDIDMQGARDYAMRIWLDPDRMAALDITAEDIVRAVQSQNTQVAGGLVAEPPVSGPAFQPSLTFRGRLDRPDEFESIVIRASREGRLLRLRDVGRVELGAASYTTTSTLQGRPAVALAITQRPGSNALATAQLIRSSLARIEEHFPPGIRADIAYDPTRFVGESVHELVRTIGEAVALVVLVVLVFLQNWRATIIPVLAIPVSLIGCFGVMVALGFTLNVLTLFGLVLAVGIVVDDAIVVVENVDRHLRDTPSPQHAAIATMQEVGGALVSIALVLGAVFVPTAFLDGIAGRFFLQFAVTIAVATALSCFCSLTLSPALASLMLRRPPPPSQRSRSRAARAVRWLSHGFNIAFERLARLYGRLVRRLTRHVLPMLLLYAGLIGAVGWILATAPRGFLPAQDRGYAVISISLPGGASLARTSEIVERAAAIAREVPGVASVSAIAGISGTTNTAASDEGMVTPVFAPWSERLPHGQTASFIVRELRRRLAVLADASVVVIPPPTVPGLGAGIGFALRLEDRTGRGTQILAAATRELVHELSRTPGLTAVYSPFRIDSPQIAVEIDRARAEMLGVSAERLSQSIETMFGSSYINDFTAYGRNWRVVAQAAPEFRRTPEDLSRLRTRNEAGQMVPLASVLTFRDVTGPPRVPRYNLYPSAEIAGETAAGLGSASAIRLVERVARRVLPDGIGYEWTDLSYEQSQAGNAGLMIFPLCVIFVYLVLAAQYGSWSLPFAVILIVPMCLLTSTLGVRMAGLEVTVLTQIGFVVLVGLAAKNAILIVEFARVLEERGRSAAEAVAEACRLRLRAILMTSLAFILGVLPLVISTGAGSEMRRAVGTAVFFGMLGVTVFGLIFTPIFYVLIRRLSGSTDPSPMRKPRETIAMPEMAK